MITLAVQRTELMQIESLKVFCDLAETESFTKAAQINNVTQSAVSQQISSLERQFKSLLIERSKKKFRLTREGQVLYDYSKQIIQTYEALFSRLQEIKDVIDAAHVTPHWLGFHLQNQYPTRQTTVLMPRPVSLLRVVRADWPGPHWGPNRLADARARPCRHRWRPRRLQ